MEQLFTIVGGILTLIWAIACFIFYHKIFTVYYFSLSRGILKELLICLGVGAVLAALTLWLSTPLSIGLFVVGWILTRNIDSPPLRNISFALIAIVALIIFFTGRWFYKNDKKETSAKNTEIVIHEKEQIVTEPIDAPTIYIPEVPEATEVFVSFETEAPVYVPEETYQKTYTATEEKTVAAPVATEPSHSVLTGYVIESSGGLKIRNGPGTSYQEVGRLAPNEQVTIYEQTYGESYMWGKIDRGWVCMDYIAIGTAPKYREVNEIGYIVGSTDGVNIRSGPAVSYEQVGRAYLGQQVVVTKLHHNGISEWGYIGNGWVCTDYIHFGDVPPGTDDYGNSDPGDSSISAWNQGKSSWVGYDCYGNELRVGYLVCIGASQETSEFAVGTIVDVEDNGVPVVNFTELHNYDYPGGIMYCMNDLANKINYFGYYCGEVEAQHLLNFYYG